MKLLITTIMLTGLLLQACENAPVRRQEMIAEHPEWDKDYVHLIREGYLARGMSQDQVRAAWGRPNYMGTGTASGEWGESWEYATQVVFFDKNGKVIRWEKK